MKRLLRLGIITCIVFVVLSCDSKESKGIFTIPVNTSQNFSLPLSEIATGIKAVNLELTDESLINIKFVRRVYANEKYIVVNDYDKIMLFNKDGKFLRRIGTKGQGPGEFVNIYCVTVDFEKELLFVGCSGKLICYDFDSCLINENTSDFRDGVKYMNCVKDELILIKEYSQESDGENTFNRFVAFKLNGDMHVLDSIEIRKVYNAKRFTYNLFEDYVTFDENNTYLYFSEINAERLIRDTLYCFDNNQLVPHLKLSFKDGIASDGWRSIYLFNIYKSSRFVFSVYSDREMKIPYCFCYDLETNKEYNMKEGYTDDIHDVGKVVIRPLSPNLDKFYYLHTNMDETSDLEEPNPTLYIGTLKK